MSFFRTQVDFPDSKVKIDYSSSLMLMGSCFSESIGQKLSDLKFETDNNPFGIVYNPSSISNGLSRLINKGLYTVDDLFQHNEVWQSFDHHSRFSAVSSEDCLIQINQRCQAAAETLRIANYLFITFGTAWVYRLQSNGEVVSNCHKLPASKFFKEKLTVEQIITEYQFSFKRIFELNPLLNVIFTVSPVRHWKDGAHDNQLSKSVLLLAIDEICRLFPNVSYFPSYEIMMDELRDYRFYADDMLHPSSLAIQYIWDCFTRCFMDTPTLKVMQEVNSVIKAVGHRPFNPTSLSHKHFVKKQIAVINRLKLEYKLSFNQEEDLLADFL